jgi:hypothetical protein
MKRFTALGGTVAINTDDVDAKKFKAALADVADALGVPGSTAPVDLLQAALGYVNALEAGDSQGDGPDAGDRAQPAAGGDPAANALSRTHRVEAHGKTFEVRLTGRQLATIARQGMHASRYAQQIAHLWGETPKAAQYGVKLSRGPL